MVSRWMTKRTVNILLLGLLAGLLWAPFAALRTPAAYGQAEEQAAAETGGKNVHVQADKLVSGQEADYIHFMGNVTVTLENTRIWSRELKVYYDPQSGGDANVSRENIKKIVATGDVRIDTENRTATCDKAEYRAATEILVLTGESVKIKSESNSITGNKITFNRKTGEIVVDGDPAQRVNAVIEQGKEEMMAPETESQAP